MASNFFGQIFRITTFGESHGELIGVVIDGCPAGLSIEEKEINQELFFRKPGRSPMVSSRSEPDQAQIVSGVFEGQTTGAPIAILIRNQDADSSSYESMKDLYRPGHANFTYLEKYGLFDYRGGGRASGRETAVRVAAGAIAKKLLARFHIQCMAYLSEMGRVAIPSIDLSDLALLQKNTHASAIFCPDPSSEQKMIQELQEVQKQGDSIGGVVTGVAHLPAGLGDPIYGKLEAMLASAMLSIPASKGFDIGSGFAAARMRGSQHNDPFELAFDGKPRTATNHAGGTLGGISTGSPLYFRVAFKPASSIKKPQSTVNIKNEQAILQMPDTARHDPCLAIRAVPVVEAMTALVLADALLLSRLARA